MSIKGKKIATLSQSIIIAKSIISTEAEAIKHHWLIGASMRRVNIAQCHAMANVLMSTPHQYFNSLGKIDKRKQRRHDRKVGAKVRTTRLIRAKIGKPMKPMKPMMIGIDPANGKDKSVRANVTIKNGVIGSITITPDLCAGDIIDALGKDAEEATDTDIKLQPLADLIECERLDMMKAYDSEFGDLISVQCGASKHSGGKDI